MELTKQQFLEEVDELANRNQKVKLLMSNGWEKVGTHQQGLILKELNMTIKKVTKTRYIKLTPEETDREKNEKIRKRQMEELQLVYDVDSEEELMNALIQERYSENFEKIRRAKGENYKGRGTCKKCKQKGLTWLSNGKRLCKTCKEE